MKIFSILRVKFYCLFTEKETEMDEKGDEKADEKAVVTSTESPDQSHKVCLISFLYLDLYEPVHEISNILACATGKASDQPAHTRSLIRA